MATSHFGSSCFKSRGGRDNGLLLNGIYRLPFPWLQTKTMNVDSEKGVGQKRKSDDYSTAEMMESLRNDLFLRFGAITAKPLEHDAHRAEVGAPLRELNA